MEPVPADSWHGREILIFEPRAALILNTHMKFHSLRQPAEKATAALLLKRIVQSGECRVKFLLCWTLLSSSQVTCLLTPWSLKLLCSSLWRLLVTTPCIWTSQKKGSGCFIGNCSVNPTCHAVCVISCTSSWKRKCLQGSYRIEN